MNAHTVTRLDFEINLQLPIWHLNDTCAKVTREGGSPLFQPVL